MGLFGFLFSNLSSGDPKQELRALELKALKQKPRRRRAVSRLCLLCLALDAFLRAQSSLPRDNMLQVWWALLCQPAVNMCHTEGQADQAAGGHSQLRFPQSRFLSTGHKLRQMLPVRLMSFSFLVFKFSSSLAWTGVDFFSPYFVNMPNFIGFIVLFETGSYVV